MKFFLIYTFLISCLYSFEDLGTTGRTYNIQEENFQEMLNREASEYLKTIDLKAESEKAVKKASFYSSSLGFCKKETSLTSLDETELQENIYTPTGRIYKAKGEKIVVPTPKPINLCFVDGTNDIVLENQINYFKKQTEKYGGCLFLVSNKSVLELYEKYNGLDLFPASETYEKRFGINCYPSFVHLIKENRYNFTFSINQFSHNKEVSK